MEFFQLTDRCGVKILIVLVTFEEHFEVAQIASLHLRGKFPKLLDQLVLFGARHLTVRALKKSRCDVAREFVTLSLCAEGGT